ncbi:MAG: phosphonoacetate hydrolase [Candidatus Latescibacterota bacterium]|nr:phosphonoacetate hydrolase [Candidatus Latescibacterota bacterium]
MIEVNDRRYRPRDKTIVGICIDGCAREYLDEASAVMPNLRAIEERGNHGLVHTIIPSFTNPNNVAIVTGAPPAVNGIPGNFYYDVEADEEVLMNDPRFLRAPTILAAFHAAGQTVAAITTKDKLRLFLARGWQGINFSVEKAHEVEESAHHIADVIGLVGRPNPDIYDPEASVYCIEAGARLLARHNLNLLYLSTTDFVQHKWAPGAPEANAFYARLDRFIGELDTQDTILGITADHGMNAKTNADGSPKVQFLETKLVAEGIGEARVILPITDPYVVHHGALGSYATIYVDDAHIEQAKAILRAIPGVEKVLTRPEAAAAYQLPPDRIGELVVLSDQHTVLGRTPDWHDLADVAKGLRSHGGLHEGVVPLICNRPLTGEYAKFLASGQAHNWDLFDFLCNGVVD